MLSKIMYLIGNKMCNEMTCLVDDKMPSGMIC